MNKEIYNEVKCVLVNKHRMCPEFISPEADIDICLGLDSLDKWELRLNIMAHFGIDLALHKWEKCETVSDIVNLIDKELWEGE